MRYLFFMYFRRLQTSTVWFLSLFSEGLMCMRQNFKLLCCADYILNLIVSICLSCLPNLWCSGIFSAEFRGCRKNSANLDNESKMWFSQPNFLKNPAEGSKHNVIGYNNFASWIIVHMSSIMLMRLQELCKSCRASCYFLIFWCKVANGESDVGLCS